MGHHRLASPDMERIFQGETVSGSRNGSSWPDIWNTAMSWPSRPWWRGTGRW